MFDLDYVIVDIKKSWKVPKGVMRNRNSKGIQYNC